MRQFWRRRNGTGLALAGLLSLAVVLGGCDVVNNILGRSGGQTAGAAGGFGGGAGDGGFGGQPAALPVVTADVVRETVSNFLVATTTLSAERALDVLARASGEVVEVLVEEGDAVREGQLLAQLDPSDRVWPWLKRRRTTTTSSGNTRARPNWPNMAGSPTRNWTTSATRSSCAPSPWTVPGSNSPIPRSVRRSPASSASGP